jgi:hypothetical protein
METTESIMEEMKANRRRTVACRNTSEKIVCHILPGECGLVSPVDFAHNKWALRPVRVADLDQKKTTDGVPVRKKAKATTTGEEAPEAA